MNDLHASMDGVKAAIVSGLAPGIKIIVDRLRDWFVGHRADIAEFAQRIGENLPAAFEKAVSAVKAAVAAVKEIVGWLKDAYQWAKELVDTMRDLGKFFNHPLDATFGDVHLALSPETQRLVDQARRNNARIMAAPSALDVLQSKLQAPRPDVSSKVDRAFSASGARSAGPGAAQAAALSNAKITVDFANAPRGTRVRTDPKSTADVDLSVGYQMGTP
jgi:hypothetical protein